jgi:hypothetical protein
MSVGPRVVFVRFLTSESPKLNPWVSHRTRVLDAAAAPSPALNGDVVVWQLVSANNRQLARGASLHGSFESAHESALAAVSAGDGLAVTLVSEAGRGVYGWYASLDGEPAMTCSRWYLTDRDRRYSIDIAMRSVASAILHSGARLTDPALMGGDRDWSLQ